MRPFSDILQRGLLAGSAALALAACNTEDNDPGPGGVSVGEARALDEAAEMIEARRLPPGAVRQQGEEGEDQNNAPDQENTPQ